MKKALALLSIIALMFMSACSDSTSSDKKSAPPENAIKTVEFTTAISPNHTDQNAQSVRASVESFGGMINLYSAFFQLEQYNWEQNGNTWTYSETQDNITVTVTITETDAGYVYTMSMNGTDTDGTVYNGVLLEAFTAKDGSNGYWKLYDPTSTTTLLMFEFTWTVNSNNAIVATAKTYDSDGSVYSQANVTINSDKSGTYQLVDADGNTMQTASWNADGSGSVTYYYTDPPTTYTWGPNPA